MCTFAFAIAHYMFFARTELFVNKKHQPKPTGGINLQVPENMVLSLSPQAAFFKGAHEDIVHGSSSLPAACRYGESMFHVKHRFAVSLARVTCPSSRMLRVTLPGPAAYAACRFPALFQYSEKSAIISRLKAGKSFGLRLLTQFRSRTTSASSHTPHAFLMSSWIV
jgi:hypothetical protein